MKKKNKPNAGVVYSSSDPSDDSSADRAARRSSLTAAALVAAVGPSAAFWSSQNAAFTASDGPSAGASTCFKFWSFLVISKVTFARAVAEDFFFFLTFFFNLAPKIATLSAARPTFPPFFFFFFFFGAGAAPPSKAFFGSRHFLPEGPLLAFGEKLRSLFQLAVHP